MGWIHAKEDRSYAPLAAGYPDIPAYDPRPTDVGCIMRIAGPGMAPAVLYIRHPSGVVAAAIGADVVADLIGGPRPADAYGRLKAAGDPPGEGASPEEWVSYGIRVGVAALMARAEEERLLSLDIDQEV